VCLANNVQLSLLNSLSVWTAISNINNKTLPGTTVISLVTRLYLLVRYQEKFILGKKHSQKLSLFESHSMPEEPP
jgi:hypothetical protein